MPLRVELPIVEVKAASFHTIETGNPENLFGLWSVFSKCSPAMEQGRRYENIMWRVWAKETFCCAPDHTFPPRSAFTRKLSDDLEVPSLSSSVESSASSKSDSAVTTTTFRSNSSSRPFLRRNDSTESRSRGKEKHITPIDLEKVVNSIQEKKTIKPLSPLPHQLSQALPTRQKICEDTTPRPSSPPRVPQFIPESSTSTVATALGSDSMSPPIGSDVSTSTDLSSHSIVRGFAPGRISSSIRSSTNLHATPTPILKSSAPYGKMESKEQPAKKKAPMFTLGGSSDEGDNSSFETSMYLAKRSSLSDNLKKPAFNRKTTSFKDEVVTRTIHDAASSEESEEAIESESEEEDSDDNAIEDDDYDDDDDQWEDDDNSGPSSVNDRELFQRVDSRPNLTSHRSLLTTLMHEGDRAQALQNAASRSTPAMRRSRTTSPNGPSLATTPQEEDSGLMMRATQVPRSKPIIMTTSNTHPPALSPRTTRRNMLQTELTESLRKNLLWERQQKNATTNAVNKRHHSAVSIPALRRAMTTNDIRSLNAFPREGMGKPSAYRDMAKNNSSYNEYFDQGLQEYHQKGW